MRKLLFIAIFSFVALSVNAQSKANSPISTTSSSISVKKVSILPNPAVADIKISVEGTDSAVRSVSIYSIIGNEVFSQSYNSTSKSIDINVRNLKKGKYMVRVIFEDNSSEVVALMKQ
ncbi:MAG: T9SS type A sorting domain-containing protein [Weeksellaceae bacterium]|nr:T9SS type A sorting domain-containing protein [Weeksellaceae bacterium]